jgi:RNA polymerase sigma factor (sigma-70 family)
MTDGQLLEQFVRHQDSAAFETLVRRHGPMVLRVCERLLRHGPDADDAFQATFIVLVRKAHSIIKLESVASWLYGVAYRIALRAKVRSNRRLARERQIDEGAVPGGAVPAGLGDLRPVLDEELNRLPEKYRAPLVLCYLEGKTNEEAAAQLHWPTGTVKVRLMRARDMLRNRLGRRGLTLTAGALALLLTQEAAQAAVPATLTSATAQAVTLAGAGTAAAAAPTGAVALADATVKAMALVKVKVACGVALAASLVVAGAVYVAAPKQNDRPPLQLQTTLEHKDGVFAATFSPDGRTVATSGGERVIRLWDTATGQELAKIAGHRLPIQSVAISPDGMLLASGAGDIGGPPGEVKLWDLRQRHELAMLPPHEHGASSVAFSPNGKILATASWRGVIYLWDIATRGLLTTLDGHTSGVARICFSPDGKMLASASNDRTVKLWDVATGKESATLRGHSAVVHAVAFAPDGRSVASGGPDKTIRVWDVQTHETKLAIPCSGTVHCVGFAPSGNTLLSGHTSPTKDGEVGVLTLWDLRNGSAIASWNAHRIQLGSAMFSPDGQRFLTTSWDRTAKLWDVNTGSRAWAPSR